MKKLISPCGRFVGCDGIGYDELWLKNCLDKAPQASDEEKAEFPKIEIFDEEFLGWCQQWKGVLVVKLLGERMSFHIIEELSVTRFHLKIN